MSVTFSYDFDPSPAGLPNGAGPHLENFLVSILEARLPGYDAADAGEIISLRRTLPWYK